MFDVDFRELCWHRQVEELAIFVEIHVTAKTKKAALIAVDLFSDKYSVPTKDVIDRAIADLEYE